MLERIEQAFEARRASEEGMRRFLGHASHELRTPVTSIRGNAELFRRGADERPEDLRLSMRRIEEEAARMGILVDEPLLLAHSDRIRPTVLTAVDLSQLVADAGRDARARDPQRPIDVDLADDVLITADEDRLRQALNNLVTNALVHTPEGTTGGTVTAVNRPSGGARSTLRLPIDHQRPSGADAPSSKVGNSD